MSEYLYLALSAVVFLVGLIIGIALLRRAMKEQIEYEQQLRTLATGASTAASGASAPAAPAPPPVPAAAAPEAAPAPPAPAGEGAVSEADAKAKVEAAKAEIETVKAEGKDVSSADKLLQLATSCLYSGDFERAVKYATKASKQIQDIKERGAAEKAPEAPPAPAPAPAAEGEDPQQKEAVGIISAVQAKIAGVKEESVEKSEVENLLRLATSFLKSKSYAKALRYAKQAEEKANALAK
ncbi:MAG: hypothetical protein ACUVV6_03335 [Thermoplasmatota archaeon]